MYDNTPFRNKQAAKSDIVGSRRSSTKESLGEGYTRKDIEVRRKDGTLKKKKAVYKNSQGERSSRTAKYSEGSLHGGRENVTHIKTKNKLGKHVEKSSYSVSRDGKGETVRKGKTVRKNPSSKKRRSVKRFG